MGPQQSLTGDRAVAARWCPAEGPGNISLEVHVGVGSRHLEVPREGF